MAAAMAIRIRIGHSVVEQHRAGVHRPSPRIDLAVQLTQIQVAALPASHIPDQRPLGATAVAHRKQTCIARSWGEADLIDARCGAIPQLGLSN
jgi:hypothetical protein